ncbi:methyltransferase domain-containing protein [Solimonas marina]|uniref:Malonyl-[acyl-carrier protein] O-methyltransferase n=1 Tax=Solimonas marina TaxID=2714601 RepID=A0A969W9U6_9GAMM|nr:methyltransferase domain-containing protein [Solimonas marina]NKF22204.1 methyltransferase domain-containing protein [Solimonas marina]
MSGHLPVLDVRRAARNFSRAAAGYERAAQLQDRTRKALLARVAALQPVPRTIVDLGCGTGLGARALQLRHPQATVVALDRAPGMAQVAHRSGSRMSVVGDAQALPLRAASADLLFSNLVLQWCPQPQCALAELARVLAPGGVAALSVPGAGTLDELRAAWRAVDTAEHVHAFATQADWSRWARDAGLVVRTAETVLYPEYHADVRALMQSLRDIGARNSSAARRQQWLGKSTFAQLDAAYAPWRYARGVRASWHIIELLLERSG